MELVRSMVVLLPTTLPSATTPSSGCLTRALGLTTIMNFGQAKTMSPSTTLSKKTTGVSTMISTSSPMRRMCRPRTPFGQPACLAMVDTGAVYHRQYLTPGIRMPSWAAKWLISSTAPSRLLWIRRSCSHVGTTALSTLCREGSGQPSCLYWDGCMQVSRFAVKEVKS